MDEFPDLDALRLLVALDDAGTVTAAARARHLSQPAATHRLARLADALGAPVIERQGRGVRLTAAGRAAVARARRVLAELTGLRADLRALADLTAGEVRIGGGTSSNLHLLPGPMAAFRQRHPGVALFLKEADTATVLAALAAGTLDVGVVALPAAHPGVVVRPWLAEEVLLVGRPGEPLTAGPFPAAALTGQPWITLWAGSRLRAVTDAALAAAGAAPRVVMELEDVEALKAFAAAGLGYAPVGARAAARELAEGRLVALRPEGLGISRAFGLATREGPLPPAVAAFVRALVDGASEQAIQSSP